ncbi:hypothetical protein OAD97_00370 [bacterium]|nr:hypothetical protein [bacterium]
MLELQNKSIVRVKNDIMLVDILTQYPKGKFRMVSKTKLGFTVVDARQFENERMVNNPESIISGFKRGTLQTVEFCPDGSDFYLTIFARVGKKVKLIDESIMADLTVGTINSMYDNTNLYNQNQYQAVNSKTWASKAYVMNEVESLCV